MPVGANSTQVIVLSGWSISCELNKFIIRHSGVASITGFVRQGVPTAGSRQLKSGQASSSKQSRLATGNHPPPIPSNIRWMIYHIWSLTLQYPDNIILCFERNGLDSAICASKLDRFQPLRLHLAPLSQHTGTCRLNTATYVCPAVIWAKHHHPYINYEAN